MMEVLCVEGPTPGTSILVPGNAKEGDIVGPYGGYTLRCFNVSDNSIYVAVGAGLSDWDFIMLLLSVYQYRNTTKEKAQWTA